jgi:hypothetical protein
MEPEFRMNDVDKFLGQAKMLDLPAGPSPEVFQEG